MERLRPSSPAWEECRSCVKIQAKRLVAACKFLRKMFPIILTSCSPPESEMCGRGSWERVSCCRRIIGCDCVSVSKFKTLPVSGIVCVELAALLCVSAFIEASSDGMEA